MHLSLLQILSICIFGRSCVNCRVFFLVIYIVNFCWANFWRYIHAYDSCVVKVWRWMRFINQVTLIRQFSRFLVQISLLTLFYLRICWIYPYVLELFCDFVSIFPDSVRILLWLVTSLRINSSLASVKHFIIINEILKTRKRILQSFIWKVQRIVYKVGFTRQNIQRKNKLSVLP